MFRAVIEDPDPSASPYGASSSVRSPTSTATEVRSPTSTSTEVRSPTSTSTEVRSPTSTSTDAYTSGNITVTGGAGAGHTCVTIHAAPHAQGPRADEAAHSVRSQGAAYRMPQMINETMASRVTNPMPDMMRYASSPRAPMPATMSSVYQPGVSGLGMLGVPLSAVSVSTLLLVGVGIVTGVWFLKKRRRRR